MAVDVKPEEQWHQRRRGKGNFNHTSRASFQTDGLVSRDSRAVRVWQAEGRQENRMNIGSREHSRGFAGSLRLIGRHIVITLSYRGGYVAF